MSADAVRLRRWAPGAFLAWTRTRPRAEQREWQPRVRRTELHDVEPRRGEAWFPLVAPGDVRGVPGVLARVSVRPSPHAVAPSTLQRLRTWAQDAAGGPGFREVGLYLHGVPPGWRVEGRSLELAALVALLSELLARKPRQPVVASGAVDDEALGAVGHVQAKRRIGELELEDPERLVVLREAREPSPLLRRWLGADWLTALTLASGLSLEERGERAWSLYGQGRFDDARAEADVLRAETDGVVAARAAWLAGACRMHRGHTDEARVLLEEALAGLEAERRDCALATSEELAAYLGVALLDALRPREAVATLQAAWTSLEQWPDELRDRRWRAVAVQVLGSLRRALVLSGELDGALGAQERSLALAPSSQRARCLGDLADLHVRRGETSEAAAALQQAREALPACGRDERPLTARYLVLHEARAGLRPARWPLGAPDWTDLPQPLEALESALALGRETFERYTDALGVPDNPVYALAFSSAAARAAVRYGPLPWATALAEALLRHETLGPDALAALEALRQGDGEAWWRRAPY